jgi:hypothetical protein
LYQLVGLPIPGSLSEEVNERLAGGGVTSSGSTQGLPQGRVDDVNAALSTKIFKSSTPGAMPDGSVTEVTGLSWVRSQHPPTQWNLRGGR